MDSLLHHKTMTNVKFKRIIFCHSMRYAIFFYVISLIGSSLMDSLLADGLVTMRPSHGTNLSRFSLSSVSPVQQRQMFQCFTQCLQDPCCRAVNVHEKCEQSYIHTEDMDFVKEVRSFVI